MTLHPNEGRTIAGETILYSAIEQTERRRSVWHRYIGPTLACLWFFVVLMVAMAMLGDWPEWRM